MDRVRIQIDIAASLRFAFRRSAADRLRAADRAWRSRPSHLQLRAIRPSAGRPIDNTRTVRSAWTRRVCRPMLARIIAGKQAQNRRGGRPVAARSSYHSIASACGVDGEHGIAARMDDRWDFVAGALSSDPQKALASAADLRLDLARAYPSWQAMLEGETKLRDGGGPAIDAVAIVTPNHVHHGPAKRLPRGRLPRHLRQADDHDAGRCRGPGRRR